MADAPGVVVSRDTHTVVVAGHDTVHLQFDVETGLSGEMDFQTPVSDDVIADLGPPYSTTWDAKISRERPYRDDPFDTSMPATIANLGFRGEYDGTGSPTTAEEIDRIYMSHLYVQPQARRMGYGQLMWDIYLAVIAYSELPAAGGIGSTEGGKTYDFLVSQGIPESDISPGRHTPGEGRGVVKWKTAAMNVTADAPIFRQEFEI